MYSSSRLLKNSLLRRKIDFPLYNSKLHVNKIKWLGKLLLTAHAQFWGRKWFFSSLLALLTRYTNTP